MTEFRNRKRKPAEDLGVYAFPLESVLRRTIPDVGEMLCQLSSSTTPGINAVINEPSNNR